MRSTVMISKEASLVGRSEPLELHPNNACLGASMIEPFPEGSEVITIALGCFWGAERVFWQVPGVITTMVGYAGGFTPNPTYEEVCTGNTGHTEVVRVVFNPAKVTLQSILQIFWEKHDPTQGMRQGNDIGTQYRSAIYANDEAQLPIIQASRQAYQNALTLAKLGEISTEIELAGPFYYAEDYHQQYLFKNPEGYCGIGGTGVSCPI